MILKDTNLIKLSIQKGGFFFPFKDEIIKIYTYNYI
jgi:hypothetical protein